MEKQFTILNTDKQHDFGPFATHCVWMIVGKEIYKII